MARPERLLVATLLARQAGSSLTTVRCALSRPTSSASVRTPDLLVRKSNRQKRDSINSTTSMARLHLFDRLKPLNATKARPDSTRSVAASGLGKRAHDDVPGASAC